MAKTIAVQCKDYCPTNDEAADESLLSQYEKLVTETLLSSFGLEALLQTSTDQVGGDVDTIHNVRNIGKEPGLGYKSAANAQAYAERGAYDSKTYHSHPDYIAKNRAVSEARKNGTLVDGYTGEQIARNGKSDLDHILSAKSIHDDPGRVLAGLDGADLANAPENLTPTNPHTNRTKKADDMNGFLRRRGEEYSPEIQQHMRDVEAQAKTAYDNKVARAYYTSPRFRNDVQKAATKLGATTGLKQAMGFCLAEIWFAVRERLHALKRRTNVTMKERMQEIAEGFHDGFLRVKRNFRTLLAKFGEGMLSGVLASLCTTLANIFFTTAKHVVAVIRQAWASLVKAFKVLFVNPNHLTFGQRLHEVAKILIAAAGSIAGVLLAEVLNKTPIGQIPVVGEPLTTFVSMLLTGLVSCTLIYELDHGDLCKKLAQAYDPYRSYRAQQAFYEEEIRRLDAYAAQLARIDVNEFARETRLAETAVRELATAQSLGEFRQRMQRSAKALGVRVDYGGYGSLEACLADPHAHLTFS